VSSPVTAGPPLVPLVPLVPGSPLEEDEELLVPSLNIAQAWSPSRQPAV